MTDWCWCFENPKEAAQLIDDLSKDIESLRIINSAGHHKHISELEAKCEKLENAHRKIWKQILEPAHLYEIATRMQKIAGDALGI